MEQTENKKSHLASKIFFALLIFAGIAVYAYFFPTTMELFDDKISEIIALTGKDFECDIFGKFAGFTKELINEILYRAEIIKDNIEGNFDDTKKVSLVLFSCAANFPAEEKIITSEFGKRTNPITGKDENHTGVDIAAAFGSEITAAWPGTVYETGFDEIYGNYIIIEHSEGFFTKYCHLSKICVEKNKRVMAKEKIGEAGSTGYSTGSHLHFEVSVSGINVDPRECFAL